MIPFVFLTLIQAFSKALIVNSAVIEVPYEYLMIFLL